MQTQLDCIPCFIRQSLEAVRQICDDDEVIKKSLKRVLKEASEFDMNLSPPEMGQKIHRIIREESGNSDPYQKIKEKSTEYALALVDDVKQKLKESNDVFSTAIRFAIAGNIMDFALFSAWDMSRIEDSFNKVSNHPVNEKMIGALKDDIKKADNVLILGDNAGEAVFDRILIENLPKEVDVYYAVKETPIINDATLKDAKEAGIHNVAKIISNGTDAPGTILDKCSSDFMTMYKSSDVVIAKGQANFETLNLAERKVYFLTQIKCPVIADRYGYKVGDWIVTTTDELKNSDRKEEIA
jgi:damage-control phosphatase, subfamily I